MDARVTVRRVGLPARWRVAIDGLVVAHTPDAPSAWRAAQTAWGARVDEREVDSAGSPEHCYLDSDRATVHYHRVYGGWMPRDATDREPLEMR